MPSKVIINTSGHHGLEKNTSRLEAFRAPASVGTTKPEVGDAMSSTDGPDVKRIKINFQPSEGPKPEGPMHAQNIQIIGADSSKTLFNQLEFASLQRKLCKEGQPFVLVKDKPSPSPVEKFVLGSEYMARLNAGDISDQDLLNASAVLFHTPNAKRPDVVPLSLLVTSDPDLGLLDALLAVNSPHQNAQEVHKRQYLIAAMMSSGVFAVNDPRLATTILKRIPEKLKKAGLNAALLDCLDHKNPSIAKQLLEWGADPNAVDPDDSFSVLGSAIRSFNEPMVLLLLEHGADPYRETETDCSAVDLVTSEPYTPFARLLKQFPAAP